MARRPDIGYFDRGRDLLDPANWAGPAGITEVGASLDPMVFGSLEFSYLEDEAIWTRDWIGLGTSADLEKVGDLIPFTAGNHGVHVQRLGDGSLIGRFNNAQHGGCRVVPVQCQQGVKTRCSFTSCGYSRDRRPMSMDPGGGTAPEMYQYLGLRPERLLQISVGRLGPVVLGNLDGPERLFKPDRYLAEWLAGCPSGWPARRSVEWLEFAANWKMFGEALIETIDTRPLDQGACLYASGSTEGQYLGAVWCFPNILLLCTATHFAAIVIQPTATERVLARVELFGAPDMDGTAAAGLRTMIASAGLAAESLQTNPGAPCPGQSRQWLQAQLIERVTAMPRVEPSIPLFQSERHYRI